MVPGKTKIANGSKMTRIFDALCTDGAELLSAMKNTICRISSMVSFASGPTSVVDGGASINGDDHLDVLRWSFLYGHSRLAQEYVLDPLE